jgi:hypothetical protein
VDAQPTLFTKVDWMPLGQHFSQILFTEPQPLGQSLRRLIGGRLFILLAGKTQQWQHQALIIRDGHLSVSFQYRFSTQRAIDSNTINS